MNNCVDCLSTDLNIDFQWFVLHKGWIDKINDNVINKVLTEMNPVHSNPVFVTFSIQKDLPVISQDNVHLVALFEQIKYQQDARIAIFDSEQSEQLNSQVDAFNSALDLAIPDSKNIDSSPSLLQMPSHIKMTLCGSNDNPVIPSLENPGSQLCTASQFYSSEYKRWTDEIAEPHRLHRKQWEFVYILSVLDRYDKLNQGVTGIGFGCGKEPIASVMVNHGCKILLSDLNLDDASQKGWVASDEHSHQLKDLHKEEVCEWNIFEENASFMTIDMNHIPSDLPKFDFIWSSCALEHLGSLRHGIDFILNSSTYLKPGGIAVHTTEYNLSSNDLTIEAENICVYRRKDIEELVEELSMKNLEISPVNFFCGDRVEDGFIDVPPYSSDIHLKLLLSGTVTTSIGLVIHKPQ
jgi:2-polyprenyl-3-methyl-5-hydroxy-6-metoxy-1,4-benzoquinol methylase